MRAGCARRRTRPTTASAPPRPPNQISGYCPSTAGRGMAAILGIDRVSGPRMNAVPRPQLLTTAELFVSEKCKRHRQDHQANGRIRVVDIHGSVTSYSSRGPVSARVAATIADRNDGLDPYLPRPISEKRRFAGEPERGWGTAAILGIDR